MKVLVCCVSYNTEVELIEYIQSLYAASQEVDGLHIDLNIANTGELFTSKLTEEFYEGKLSITIHESIGNIGYFPGMKLCLDYIKDKDKYDYLIISNVDLTVANDFFSKLKEQKSNAIIAPSIMSSFENKDRNPKIIARLRKKDMKKYQFLYSIPYLHHLYKTYLYPRKLPNKVNCNDTNVYAPHGSFIIFSGLNKYWEEYLSYPIFLFGEEIYIAEIAVKHGHNIYYEQSLIVHDKDHVSTGAQNEYFLRTNNLAAIKYLKSSFWG